VLRKEECAHMMQPRHNVDAYVLVSLLFLLPLVSPHICSIKLVTLQREKQESMCTDA
jgi:hypothetical protein